MPAVQEAEIFGGVQYSMNSASREYDFLDASFIFMDGRAATL